MTTEEYLDLRSRLVSLESFALGLDDPKTVAEIIRQWAQIFCKDLLTQ